MQIFLFIVGLIFLIAGAELVVRGASRMAASFGIPSVIIGLTVVAFGTSAPEFAVSIKASLDGQASLTIGNVVGSNIFNVLFILGLSALIRPLIVSRQLIRIDVPLMIGASLFVFLLAWDQQLTRSDGMLLFGGLVVYTVFLIVYSRRKPQGERGVPASQEGIAPLGQNLASIVAGLFLLITGSRWLVDSAVAFAILFGVDELVIGLTIVAAGTSLPEVVTSVIASLRGERDIAVGNVVGSNLFNLLGVLGLSALLAPDVIQLSPSLLIFDLPILVAVALACLPVFFTGGIISRWEGGFLFAYYVAYTIYLVLMVSGHDGLPGFRTSMVYFVIPLSAFALVASVVQAMRRRDGVPEAPFVG